MSQVGTPAFDGRTVSVPRVRVKESTRRSLWAYLFISPFYLSFLVFGLFPIAFSFYLAFTRWTPSENTWVGLANFQNMLIDSLVHKSVLNSLWLMGVVTVFQVGLALLIAFVLNAKGMKGRDFWRAVLFLPYITSPVVLGLVWGVIFAYNGFFNYLLARVGIGPVDWLGYVTGSGLWIKPAVAIVTIWQYIGWNIILFSAGLKSIPNELYEAAMIDGASQKDVLLRITLPLLKKVTFFIVSITIIGSVQIFDVPLMLLGGVAGAGSGTLGGADSAGLTMTMSLYETAFNYGQFGYAAAIAVLLFAIILVLTVVNRRLFFRESEG
ncbi:MAG: sugar ABC transporter permease [Chloroflexi bacterium]|nr:sugar ABC transporter permease [Chloroflexota bacterium]